MKLSGKAFSTGEYTYKRILTATVYFFLSFGLSYDFFLSFGLSYEFFLSFDLSYMNLSGKHNVNVSMLNTGLLQYLRL